MRVLRLHRLLWIYLFYNAIIERETTVCVFDTRPTCINEPGQRSLYSDWLRAGRPRDRSSNPGSAEDFSLLYVIQTTNSGAHPATYAMKGGGGSLGVSFRSVELTTLQRPIPRSRICGSLRPLPHKPSRCSAWLVKHGDFIFTTP
jgi:hypothetical protein